MDCTRIWFKKKQITSGSYWSAVACDCRPDDYSRLNLLLGQYMAVAGDIGSPLSKVEEKLAEYRQTMQQAGFQVIYLDEGEEPPKV